MVVYNFGVVGDKDVSFGLQCQELGNRPQQKRNVQNFEHRNRLPMVVLFFLIFFFMIHTHEGDDNDDIDNSDDDDITKRIVYT